MKLSKQHTRFYKTESGLKKGIERFGLPAPKVTVETVDGWTAIYSGQQLHQENLPVTVAAYRGFLTI